MRWNVVALYINQHEANDQVTCLIAFQKMVAKESLYSIYLNSVFSFLVSLKTDTTRGLSIKIFQT